MKSFKRILKIILAVVFVIGWYLVAKNYFVMIGNNIKAKSYTSTVGIYVGEKSYSYMVDDKTYKCSVNIDKYDKYNDMITVRYNPKNPEECIIVTKGGSFIIGWVVIIFVTGISLILLMKSDKKKAKK